MRELLRDAAERAAHYVETLDDRPVAPRREDVARLVAELAAPLPEQGLAPAEVLEFIDELGSPATLASAGGRFFGFVIGGTLPASVAAGMLATAWDQNVVQTACSPAGVAFDAAAGRWILEALALPQQCGVAFVSGATMANFTGLCAARRALLLRHGWDADRDGLFGAPEVQVVTSAESHPTVIKALGLLGFGRARVTQAPVDEQGRVDPDRLPPLADPAIVCLQAGNVNSGASDPFREICARARDAGAWVHVDGAFGLWARSAPARAHQVDGVELADSWATDAHKWLNTPYDCGIAMLKDARNAAGAMRVSAEYLSRDAELEPRDLTPELSQRARAVEVWAALRQLGRSGIAEMIERSCQQAERFAEGLRAAGLPVLNDVVLNQVVIGFDSPAEAERTAAAIQDEGTCWCGVSRWRGRAAIRISLSCWRTTDEDVERSIDAFVRAARAAGDALPGPSDHR
jgi:glutamate/tyrosine decarboxylase-like PLP-dependent enzyme